MTEHRAEDLYQLHQLKSQYFRYLDTKDWATWRTLFTDDLVFYLEDSAVPTTAEPVSVGGDAFVANVSRSLATAVTVHHGHMPELHFISERAATGIWAMYDWVDDPKQCSSLQGFGHYHEDYLKGADQRWRISVLRLTRLRTDLRSYAPAYGPWAPWSAPSS